MIKGAWRDMTTKLFGKASKAFNKAMGSQAEKARTQHTKKDKNANSKSRSNSKYQDKKAKFDAKAKAKFEKYSAKAEIKNKKAELKQAKIKLKNPTFNIVELGKDNPVLDKITRDSFGLSWEEFATKHGANTMKVANKLKGIIKKTQGKDIDGALRKYNKNPTANNLVKLEEALFKATSKTDREALKEYKMNMAKFIPIGLAVAVALTAMPQGV